MSDNRKKAKDNDGKFKFPVDLKGDLELPEFDASPNFNPGKVKKKISQVPKEVKKNKKNKCQSNKLM